MYLPLDHGVGRGSYITLYRVAEYDFQYMCMISSAVLGLERKILSKKISVATAAEVYRSERKKCVYVIGN
jgi:hypothetical protein